MFLTRSPLRCPKAPPFDLHALGTPPALILSQDQTLHQWLGPRLRSPRERRTGAPPVVLSLVPAAASLRTRCRGSRPHAGGAWCCSVMLDPRCGSSASSSTPDHCRLPASCLGASLSRCGASPARASNNPTSPWGESFPGTGLPGPVRLPGPPQQGSESSRPVPLLSSPPVPRVVTPRSRCRRQPPAPASPDQPRQPVRGPAAASPPRQGARPDLRR